MALTKEKIREAVCKNRGGLNQASDEQIQTVWRSLTAETQKQYLDSIETRQTAKKKGKTDAVSDKNKSDL